jgi:hypothetical protein
LLDGLSSAGGSVDIEDVGDVIGGLDKREFMLREPGREAPALFTTRWAMSYLRGPLTREQVSTLMQGRHQPSAPQAEPVPAAPTAPARPAPDSGQAAATDGTAPTGGDAAETVPVAPPVAEDVPVRWLAPDAAWAAQVGAIPNGTRLAPSLVTRVSLLYDDDKLDLRQTEEWEAVLFPLDATVDPAACISVDHDDRDLRSEPPAGATYSLTDAPLGKKSYFTGAERALVDHLHRTRTMQVMRNRELKLAARVGETREQFAARCTAAAAEGADGDQVTLQTRYESRIAKARDAVGAAMDRVDQAQAAEATRRQSDIVAGAGSLLGAVLGGRRSARTMARDMSRVLTGQGHREEAAQRARSAENRAADRQEALAKLETDMARDLAAIDEKWAAKSNAIESVEVPLERSDIRVTARSLVWIPVG